MQKNANTRLKNTWKIVAEKTTGTNKPFYVQ
jgi:hypothetical protein